MVRTLDQLIARESPEIVARAKAKAAAMLLELDPSDARSPAGVAKEGMAGPIVTKPPRRDPGQ
ncbi:hypothetical protein [Halomonas mongoliensis]|uniref:hypothetical protein n=1 Tax=Halomonas mongoliensis TaxID=321265 RepID=UPI00403B250E